MDGDLLTVGHGTLGRDELGELLAGAGVRGLVDVRRYPGSRRDPGVSRDALAAGLPRHGVGYRWEERLGGRRRLPPGAAVVDTWWRVAQFTAYAAYTRTAEFAAALDDVLTQAATERVAVMCSEAVWWRCHRRLIADVAMLAHGRSVRHVMPGGRLVEHAPAEGARLVGGHVFWDGAR